MNSKPSLNWRKRAFIREKLPEGFRIKALAKIKRLEEEIPKLKVKKREEAMETYRELLWLLKDEPIYFVRS